MQNNNHILTTLLVIAFVFLFGGNAQAQTFTDGEFNYRVYDATRCILTGHVNDVSATLTIPGSATNEGTTYTVAAVGQQAFENCQALQSLILSEGISEIGEGAFQYCPNLTSVTFSNTVRYLGAGSFRGAGFTKLTVPGSVKVVMAGTFNECKKLTRVVFEDGVQSVGTLSTSSPFIMTPGSFRNCSNLISISFPGTVDFVDFLDHSPWLTEVKIAEGVKEIGGLAECKSLKSITVPSTVKKIGINAFYNTQLNDLYLKVGKDCKFDMPSINVVNLHVPEAMKSYYESKSIYKLNYQNLLTF